MQYICPGKLYMTVIESILINETRRLSIKLLPQFLQLTRHRDNSSSAHTCTHSHTHGEREKDMYVHVCTDVRTDSTKHTCVC